MVPVINGCYCKESGLIIIDIAEKKFYHFFSIFLNDIIIYISGTTQRAIKYNKKNYFMNFFKKGSN